MDITWIIERYSFLILTCFLLSTFILINILIFVSEKINTTKKAFYKIVKMNKNPAWNISILKITLQTFFLQLFNIYPSAQHSKMPYLGHLFCQSNIAYFEYFKNFPQPAHPASFTAFHWRPFWRNFTDPQTWRIFVGYANRNTRTFSFRWFSYSGFHFIADIRTITHLPDLCFAQKTGK